MSYTRKTRDVFVIQTYTGHTYGWERVSVSETRKEGQRTLEEYRENQPEYAHRMMMRREHITPTEPTTLATTTPTAPKASRSRWQCSRRRRASRTRTPARSCTT